MRVQKRNGESESVSFDKILIRLRNLSQDLNVNVDLIAQKVINHLKDGIHTKELDELAARISTTLITEHPDYGTLGSQIIISNHHKNTSTLFSDKMEELYLHYDFKGHHCPIINRELYELSQKHKTVIDAHIDYNRDYDLDYFAFKTLERSYLLRIQGEHPHIVERPQDIFMRVSLALHSGNLNKALKSYDLMSQKYFTHASPTLFNAGYKRQQLSSCFMKDTEIVTINDGVKYIQDVQIGDLVVTHNNNIKKVEQVHKNLLGERQVKKLKVSKSKPVYVTNNHRFWTITKKDQNPRWRSIDELNNHDYIAIPNVNVPYENLDIDITKYLDQHILEKCEINENNVRIVNKIYNEKYKNNSNLMIIRSNFINRYFTFTENFLNLIGIFLGDGHLMKDSRKNKIRGIGFTVHKINENLIDFISQVGEEIIGIKPSYHKMKTQNVTQILFHSEILGSFFKSILGHYFDGKFLHPIFFKLSRKHIESLFAGLITSDGCMTNNRNSVIQMSNKELINQLYHLGRLHNIDLSFRKVKKPETWKYKQPYTLSLSRIPNIIEKTRKIYENNRKEICNTVAKCNNQNTPITINNNKFLRIENIEDTEFNPKYVYTLGIEDDHSYAVEGLICENCFLLGTEDSIEGIYKTITDCGKISKWAGGIGVHISNIRSKGALIRGTNGTTSGIVPMLRVYNDTAIFVNQSNKRNGSFAIYLEPHHPDVFDFLEIRKNHGDELMRARDLFTAMWLNNLFFERVKEDGMWSLFDPDECPGLDECYGDD